MSNFRLEYNERQGMFHFDDYPQAPNTYGWVTICDKFPDKECTAFVKAVKKRYPGLYTRGKAPSLKQVKQMFAELYPENTIRYGILGTFGNKPGDNPT